VTAFAAVIVVVGSLGVGAGAAANRPALRVPDSVRRAPEVPRRVPKNSKLDSALAAMADAPARADSLAKSHRLVINRGRVQVVVHAAGKTAAVRGEVRRAGGEVTGEADAGRLVQAFVPVGKLRTLAASPSVRLVAKPAYAYPLDEPITTEALAAIGSLDWHDSGFTGAGVKVGVIDGGFGGLTAARAAGELPAGVIAKNFVDGELDTEAFIDSDDEVHGTAVAEVVSDVAPGAQIYLAKVASNIDLSEAADYLQGQGVKVITTSLGWYNLTPGDGTGFFENIVKAKRAAGIIWTTAASNDRVNHWGGSFSADADGYHQFAAEENVDWFVTDDGLSLSALPPGIPFCAFLRWNDWTAPVTPDLDLYIWGWDGVATHPPDLVAASENLQDATGSGFPAYPFPTEDACAATSLDWPYYGVSVWRYSGGPANIELFVPKMPRLDRFVEARSLANLADADSAVTVAALHQGSPYAQESYSSEGPTNGPGGSATGGKLKPDISGYANVSTTAYGVGAFNGTSAATPHVAGVAALMIGAEPTYGPNQIESLLTRRAMDIAPTGADTNFGYGRLTVGPVPTADVRVATATAAPASVYVGDHWTLTSTVTNDGPNPVDDVQIVQQVPATATFLGASAGCAHSGGAAYGGRTRGGVVTCTVGRLAAVTSATRVITVGPTEQTAVGGLISQASVRFFGTDPDATNDSRSAVGRAVYRSGQTARCDRLGTAGNDTLTGTSVTNRICGFGGNDVISGLGGNDVVNGGPGTDRVSLTTAGAAVIINLGTGTSACYPSTALCKLGSDRLIGVEYASGGNYSDRLYGSAGNNRLDGNSGNDLMYGGAGNDLLYGGAGNDKIYGQTGKDYFNGGTGTDSCPDRASTETKVSCP
jgi:uncharacterized repeat protein (TIGR01451 family)